MVCTENSLIHIRVTKVYHYFWHCFAVLIQSFTLEFHFEPNSYFSNPILTKTYKMKSEPDSADPFSFEGPEIVDCEGWVTQLDYMTNI